MTSLGSDQLEVRSMIVHNYACIKMSSRISLHQDNLRSRRVGSSLCVLKNKLYRWRGDSAFISTKDEGDNMVLKVFDFTTGMWHSEKTGFSQVPEDIPSAITGSSMVGYADSLYLFGGFGTLEAEKYFGGLYCLDLKSFQWKMLSSVNTKGSPMAKYLCGMVVLDRCRTGCLLIFGGFGLTGPNRQKGAEYHWSEEFKAIWTNELHMFDIAELKWIDIETTGSRPPPCAASTFIQIDRSRIMLFGGRQYAKRVSDVYILDYNDWHWFEVQQPLSNPWPKERSLHTAVCLVDPQYVISPNERATCEYPVLHKQRVLIVWGQDANRDPLNDTWILDTKDMLWTRHDKLLPWEGRKWHSTCAYYPAPYEAIILTSGGFTKRETELSSLQVNEIGIDTMYAKIGISSLYEQCIKSIINCDDLGCQILLLPKHIQQQIEDYKKIALQYKLLGLYDIQF